MNKTVKELQATQQERDYLKDLLVQVIENQNRSKWMDRLNMLFWIACYSLLLFQMYKGK
jgi:hypothetical protein